MLESSYGAVRFDFKLWHHELTASLNVDVGSESNESEFYLVSVRRFGFSRLRK